MNDNRHRSANAILEIRHQDGAVGAGHEVELTQQRAVYDVVREHGPLGPGEIYDHYTERVEDPRTNRTCRNDLATMVQYNLLGADGTSRDRTYVIVDSRQTSDVVEWLSILCRGQSSSNVEPTDCNKDDRTRESSWRLLWLDAERVPL